MSKIKTICDHCGAVVKETKYDFSITTPVKFKSFYACSEECFKNLLHKQGIETYPARDKRSMKLSKIALAISITAFVFQAIRIISTLL